MNAWGVGNRANQFTIVGIDNVDFGSMREIKPPRGTVDRDVIPAAVAGNWIFCLDLVSRTALHSGNGNKNRNDSALHTEHDFLLFDECATYSGRFNFSPFGPT